MSWLTRWGVLGLLDAARTPVPWGDELLVTGAAGLGDTVLMLPMLRRVQRESPRTRITVLGRAGYQPIVAMMGVPGFQASDAQALRRFDVRFFDGIISLTDMAADQLGGMERLAQVPLRIGPSWARLRPRCWTHPVHTRRLGWPRHEALRNLRLLLPFGVAATTSLAQASLDCRLAPPHASLPPDLPARDYAVLHPFSMGHAREWPLRHWIALVRELVAARVGVVLTGSAAEGHRFDQAWPAAERPVGVHAAFGRLDLAQLSLLLHRANAVVACSTGPLHLAAALGTPTIGLYAPRHGLGVDRWAALGSDVVNLQARNRCPVGRQCNVNACACIEELSVQTVAQAMLPTLRRSTAAGSGSSSVSQDTAPSRIEPPQPGPLS